MTAGDWIFYYAIEACKWLNPVVHILGLGIAIWAFLLCRKRGYFVVALYFALVVFSLLVMPHINARRASDLSDQTQKKIDEAIKQTVDRVLEQEGNPAPTSARLTIRFPFGPIVLVVGLYLLARREPRKDFEPIIGPTKRTEDSIHTR